jgi:[NiFe] hydrogenase diaphorase moiety large subunit
MKRGSRCGLGQTAGNPVLTSLEAFPGLYEAAVAEGPEGLRRSFDLSASVEGHETLRRASRAAAGVAGTAD